jgi:hypothetical protein
MLRILPLVETHSMLVSIDQSLVFKWRMNLSQASQNGGEASTKNQHLHSHFYSHLWNT